MNKSIDSINDLNSVGDEQLKKLLLSLGIEFNFVEYKLKKIKNLINYWSQHYDNMRDTDIKRRQGARHISFQM